MLLTSVVTTCSTKIMAGSKGKQEFTLRGGGERQRGMASSLVGLGLLSLLGVRGRKKEEKRQRNAWKPHYFFWDERKGEGEEEKGKGKSNKRMRKAPEIRIHYHGRKSSFFPFCCYQEQQLRYSLSLPAHRNKVSACFP